MNIRSKIGKKGWDFCVYAGQICVENPKGYNYESDLTKAEKLVYERAYQEGFYAGQHEIRHGIKDLLGITK